MIPKDIVIRRIFIHLLVGGVRQTESAYNDIIIYFNVCAVIITEIDYQNAPFRHIVPNPNIVSLYVTAFVIEILINHKVVVDIYGSDDEIYRCINQQVTKFLQS